MKKLFVLTICLLLLVSATACSIPTEYPEENNSNPVSTLLIVKEVTESTIICETDSGKYSIPNWFNGIEIKENEFIKVFHSGVVQETYPMQFASIYKMTHFTTDGKTNEVDTSGPFVPNEEPVIPVENRVYIRKYDGLIPLNKKVYPSDAEDIILFTSELENGDALVCDCLPDYVIEINENEFYYYFDTGLLFDTVAKENLAVKEKDALNELILKYLGGIFNGN
jgi:hypothetical protein